MCWHPDVGRMPVPANAVLRRCSSTARKLKQSQQKPGERQEEVTVPRLRHCVAYCVAQAGSEAQSKSEPST